MDQILMPPPTLARTSSIHSAELFSSTLGLDPHTTMDVAEVERRASSKENIEDDNDDDMTMNVTVVEGSQTVIVTCPLEAVTLAEGDGVPPSPSAGVCSIARPVEDDDGDVQSVAEVGGGVEGESTVSTTVKLSNGKCRPMISLIFKSLICFMSNLM